MAQAPMVVRRFGGRRGALAVAVLTASLALTALVQPRSAGADEAVRAMPALADLQVSYSNFIEHNGAIVLLFKVWNAGTGDAGRFTVAVKAANGAVVEVFPAPGLQAGYGVAFEHELPACIQSGFLVRTLVADSGDNVVESDERNNEKQMTFVYGPSC